MLDQPAWLNLLVIVGGSMLVATVVTLLIRWKVRKPSGESHNEVAGFIFATVGVLDAVLLAFIVFALWEGFGTAERAAAQGTGRSALYGAPTASYGHRAPMRMQRRCCPTSVRPARSASCPARRCCPPSSGSCS